MSFYNRMLSQWDHLSERCGRRSSGLNGERHDGSSLWVIGFVVALGVLVATRSAEPLLAAGLSIALVATYAVKAIRSGNAGAGWILPGSALALGLIPASVASFQLLLTPLAVLSYLRHGRISYPKKWTLVASAAALGAFCGYVAVEVETRNYILFNRTYGIDTERWSTLLAIAIILSASIINSLVEEGVWREAIVELPTSKVHTITTAIASSVAFGFAHWFGGLPSGFLGATMAGGFGLLAYLLRVWWGDSRVNFALHLTADIVIITYLI